MLSTLLLPPSIHLPCYSLPFQVNLQEFFLLWFTSENLPIQPPSATRPIFSFSAAHLSTEPNGRHVDSGEGESQRRLKTRIREGQSSVNPKRVGVLELGNVIWTISGGLACQGETDEILNSGLVIVGGCWAFFSSRRFGTFLSVNLDIQLFWVCLSLRFNSFGVIYWAVLLSEETAWLVKLFLPRLSASMKFLESLFVQLCSDFKRVQTSSSSYHC